MWGHQHLLSAKDMGRILWNAEKLNIYLFDFSLKTPEFNIASQENHTHYSYDPTYSNKKCFQELYGNSASNCSKEESSLQALGST